MSEHPILFSGPMVRAILEGRKTQTRRPVKLPKGSDPVVTWYEKSISLSYFHVAFGEGEDRRIERREITCPYQTGDILWVRESWRTDFMLDDIAPSRLMPTCPVKYEADDDATGIVCFEWGKLRPSIFMPRGASRILLRVRSVCIERVQSITGANVLAEGIDNGKSNASQGARWENMQRMAFEPLWDSTYATRGFGWAANPWVWAIEFERVKGEIRS